MLRRIFIYLCIFSFSVIASNIELSTSIINQQLIPTIKINGETVIEVKDIGSNQIFSSTFERSENIYNSLKNLQRKKSNLDIRILRKKSDYVAYVDNIEVYRVTPADVIGTNFTVYEMATTWRKNINEALALSTVVGDLTDSTNQLNNLDKHNLPIIGFLSILNNNKSFIMVLQVITFILIQIIAIWLTFKYMNNRYRLILEDFQKRLKKFQGSQIKSQNLITKLEKKILILETELDNKNLNKKTTTLQ